jgi:hypothetical protein
MNGTLFSIVSLLALACIGFTHSIYNTNKSNFIASVRKAISSDNDEAIMAAYLCSRRLQSWPRLALIFGLWASDLFVLIFRESALISSNGPDRAELFSALDMLSAAIFLGMAGITIKLYHHPANTRFSFS